MTNVRGANAFAVMVLLRDYKSDWGFTEVYREVMEGIREGYFAGA